MMAELGSEESIGQKNCRESRVNSKESLDKTDAKKKKKVPDVEAEEFVKMLK